MTFMDQLPLYDLMDPHDFRVGHRYRKTAPGSEHDAMVVKVELINDRVWVTTLDGRTISYPAHQIACITVDALED